LELYTIYGIILYLWNYVQSMELHTFYGLYNIYGNI
jgi:hypothetical protein